MGIIKVLAVVFMVFFVGWALFNFIGFLFKGKKHEFKEIK